MLSNIYFYFFVNTRGYPWISVDIKKLCGYPHNGYLMDMVTGMGCIFIQQVGYEGATTRTLPAMLTSLAQIVKNCNCHCCHAYRLTAHSCRQAAHHILHKTQIFLVPVNNPKPPIRILIN